MRVPPAQVSALASALVVALAFAAASHAAPYARGERIAVVGTVTDAAGDPVAGARVALIASHLGFDVRSFRRVESGFVRVRGVTDARGAYRLEWPWNPWYDVFRVRVEGVTAADAASGRRTASVLAEVELGRRMLEGSPVVVPLQIGGTGPSPPPPQLAGARSEPAAVVTAEPSPGVAADAASSSPPDDVRSEDQRRIFGEMGKPDRVDRLELTPGEEEVAWWYFERGRSYHFRDGRLEQVVEFDPVRSP